MSSPISNCLPRAVVPNGAPLVAHVADEIRNFRTQNPMARIIVIVPSFYSAFFLRRAVTERLCEGTGGGFFNVEFMRIEEVADRLFDSTPDRPNRPSMSRLIASELINNAVLETETPGPLTEHANNDSTLNAVQQTLQELERLDGGAEGALKRLANGARSGLYPQLTEIQRRYSDVAKEYLTRENVADFAAATATDYPETVRSTLASRIIFVLPPTPPDAYSRLRDILRRLDFTSTVEVKADSPPSTNGSDDAAQTRFYSAMGAADEPRALIRNIIADARDGIRFGEMAVFYPTSDYASRIKDALNDAGIKNCGPSPSTLAETPAGKFVSLFFAMLAEDMRRDTFTSWTSSSPVCDPQTGERVPYVQWEVISRNAKISRFSGEIEWETSLERYARLMRRRAKRASDSVDDDDASVDPESLFEIANEALKLRGFVSELNGHTSAVKPTNWNAWVDWLETVISTYLVASNRPDAEDGFGLKQITEELGRVRELDAVTRSEVDLPKFIRTVQRLLRSNVGNSSGWGSSVLVAPLAAGVGNSLKSIHILGMSEGSLPSPRRSDPLLSDGLRRELDPEGSRLLTSSDRLEIDHETFLSAKACASHSRLYWNKALMGATNESYPSPWFVDEIQKASGQTNISVKSLMDPCSKFVETVTSLSEIATPSFVASSEYEYGLWDVATRSQNPAMRDDLLNDPSFHTLAAGYTATQSRLGADFGPFDGNVGDSTLNWRRQWQTSATSLEIYAQCPYRYFLAHDLEVDQRIDPEESLELSALDKGSLVHSILEQYFNSGRAERTDEGFTALVEVAETEIERFRREEFIGYGAVFELEKVKLLRDLGNWHRTNSDVLLGYEGEYLTERPFGYRDDNGSITVNDDLSVHFRGKIDLIAISPDGERALVLDFKSGTTSYSDIEKDVTDAGKKLQLPIYSIVADEILGHATDIEAAFWFVFLSGGQRLRPMKLATLEEARERFNHVISKIVNGVESGIFPARPGDRKRYGDNEFWENCRYCPYDAVCPSDRLVSWNRKKHAPQIAEYVELAEGKS